MCGITGIYAFDKLNKEHIHQLDRSVASLDKRGPDANGKWNDDQVGLGHTRLAIIETSDKGLQPMVDVSGSPHRVDWDTKKTFIAAPPDRFPNAKYEGATCTR